MVDLDRIGTLFRGRSFSIHVYAPASMVCERFQRFIANDSPQHGGQNTYTGVLNHRSFRFERRKTYWKQFPPVLIGEVTQAEGYAEVSGQVQLASSVVSSYLSLILWAVISVAIVGFTAGDEISGNPIINGIMFGILAAVFFGVGFKVTALMSDWSGDISALEEVLSRANIENT